MAYQSSAALAGLGGTQLNSSSSTIPPGNGAASPRGLREIERLVQTLVASWHASAQVFQKRRWHRTPYRRPIVITPLDDAETPIAGPHRARGRDLSLGGLSFVHTYPLPYRKVAVTFQLESHRYAAVVARLTWCRFTRQASYQSGGKFLRTIALPELPNVHLDIEALPAA